MKIGDLVLKNGHQDKGSKAIVLAISEPNAMGNVFVDVLLEDGTVVKWYSSLVEVIDEIYA